MSLDNLIIQTADERTSKPEPSPLALLADSLHYELHQSAYGLAQTVGLQDHVGKMDAPPVATSFAGQNAQIIGRGVASFLPTIGVALAAKYGLAKFQEGSKAAEHVLLKPSALGFSVIESAGTGLTTGALLKPTDDKVAQDWSSFALDRATDGLTGALSFGTLSAASFGLSKLAQTRALTGIGADRVLKSAVGSGLVSGAAGGLINVQMESLLSDGKFTADGAKIGKSMYEMTLVGGLFGATTSGLAMLGRLPVAASTKGAALEMRRGEEPVPGVNDLSRAASPESKLADLSWQAAEDTAAADKSKHSPDPFLRVLRAEFREPGVNSDPVVIIGAFDKPAANRDFLNNHFSSQTVLARLLESGPDQPTPGDLSDLVRFIVQQPTTRPKLIEQLIESGAHGKMLSAQQLRGMEKLVEKFGAGSDIIERLAKVPALDASALSEFIANGHDSDVKLCEKVVRAGASAAQLEPSRLRGLSRLNHQFGEDSPVMKRILALEADGLEIDQLSRFIFVGSEKKLVERLVLGGAGVEQLGHERLTGLARLNTIFGADSATVEKLIELEPDGLRLQSVADFIEGDHSSPMATTQFVAMENARKTLVERELFSGAPAQHFDSERLFAVFELSRELGEESPVLESVRRLEAEDGNLLHGLGVFLSTGYNRSALVAQLIKEGATPQQLNWPNVNDLEQLLQMFTPSDRITRRVLELHSQGLALDELTRSISQSKSFLEPVVERLIEHGVSAERLRPENLSAQAILTTYLGQSSPYLKTIDDLSLGESQLEALAEFVSGKGEQGIELIKRVIDEGADQAKLQVSRLLGLSAVEEAFGVDAPAERHLLELEKSDLNFGYFATFLRPGEDLAQRKLVVEQMIADNLEGRSFSDYYMTRRLELTEALGADSPGLKTLRELEAKGLLLCGIANFLQSHKGSGQHLLKRLLDEGASVGELEPGRLHGLANLEKMLADSPGALKRLLEFEKQGVALRRLADFVKEDAAVNLPMLKDMLNRDFTARQMNLVNLRDRHSLDMLSQQFGGDREVLRYLDQLQVQGLSATRLANYIEERPDTRKGVVERLVQAKANLSRFNDQMRLLAFPEQIAERLVDASRQGGMSAAQLIGHLRQWQLGRYFLNLTVDQVESGRSLAASDMQALAQRAKELASGDREQATLLVSGDRVTAGSVPGDGLASVLTLAAEQIDRSIPREKPIVLLGRDMGPMLPLLRAMGREAQYFLWSRLQHKDAPTMAQWRKEIPPHAAVIDTGFNGSIITAILKGDQTVTGFLLSKNHDVKYTQLLPEDSEHNLMVNRLECLAKPIGRASSYTDNGGALARTKELVLGDVASKNHNPSGKSRFLVERQLRDIFRQAGLPDWDAWRYSQFVGLTPQERLGLDTKQEVQEHYKRIEQLRQNANIEPAQ